MNTRGRAEEQHPIDFGAFGLSPDVHVAMLLRTHDIPVAAAQPFRAESASVEEDAETEADSTARAALEEGRSDQTAKVRRRKLSA